MYGYGLDETKDPKPELRLEGAQIALAHLADPKVGQKFKLEAEVVIHEVYNSGPEEEPALRRPPYVCFKVSSIELEPEMPDPMVAIQRMYPSSTPIVMPV
jgi:hypothetical protein